MCGGGVGAVTEHQLCVALARTMISCSLTVTKKITMSVARRTSSRGRAQSRKQFTLLAWIYHYLPSFSSLEFHCQPLVLDARFQLRLSYECATQLDCHGLEAQWQMFCHSFATTWFALRFAAALERNIECPRFFCRLTVLDWLYYLNADLHRTL